MAYKTQDEENTEGQSKMDNPDKHDQIEDEKHVLLDCPLYADLRKRLFNEVKRSNVHFIILSDDDKFIYLFKSTECYNTVAKTCFNILSRRNSFLYS